MLEHSTYDGVTSQCQQKPATPSPVSCWIAETPSFARQGEVRFVDRPPTVEKMGKSDAQGTNVGKSDIVPQHSSLYEVIWFAQEQRSDFPRIRNLICPGPSGLRYWAIFVAGLSSALCRPPESEAERGCEGGREVSWGRGAATVWGGGREDAVLSAVTSRIKQLEML
eukprot:2327701-Rhodomonas_salina.1